MVWFNYKWHKRYLLYKGRPINTHIASGKIRFLTAQFKSRLSKGEEDAK